MSYVMEPNEPEDARPRAGRERPEVVSRWALTILHEMFI